MFTVLLFTVNIFFWNVYQLLIISYFIVSKNWEQPISINLHCKTNLLNGILTIFFKYQIKLFRKFVYIKCEFHPIIVIVILLIKTLKVLRLCN